MWESRQRRVFGCLLLLLCKSTCACYAIEKPLGVFSSSGATGEAIYENPQLRGVLVRASWRDLEPSPGQFDFTAIDVQANKIRSEGLPWSLAVIAGGIGSPDWLLDDLNAPFISYSFRGIAGYRLPLIWDSLVQTRLELLAEELANQYQDDDSLQLVYVPQMTSNGIEGHLQGVNMIDFATAGYSDERWVTASVSNAQNFASAFSGKALAFEVHDVNGGSEVPMTIIETLWNDEELEQRVGAAIWWLSGKTTYQPILLEALADFPGDLYAQLIANSAKPDHFEGEDIATPFAQAKSLGVRYIEPWEYEFKYTAVSANGAWDALLADFNDWATAEFTPALEGLEITLTESHLIVSGDWLTEDAELLSSPDFLQWLPVEDSIYQADPPAFLLNRPDEQSPQMQFYRVQEN